MYKYLFKFIYFLISILTSYHIESNLKKNQITPPIFSLPDELFTLYITLINGFLALPAFFLHFWRFIFNFKKIIYNIPIIYHFLGLLSVLSVFNKYTTIFNAFFRIYIASKFNNCKLFIPIIDIPITILLFFYLIKINIKELDNIVYNFSLNDFFYHIFEFFLFIK